MATFDWRTRLRAALYHFSGSVLVAGLAAALVFLVWYPWPYTALAGGLGLFVLVTTVDIVMGPVITFSIFDRRKGWPELRRDLAIVVLLQLAALGFGLYTMYVARPVALAWEQTRFRVATANAVQVDELPQAVPAFRRLPLTGPVLVRTEVPTDGGDVMESIDKALQGVDLGLRPKFWRPWDDIARTQVREVARPLTGLRQRYPARAAEFDAAVARTGRPEAQLRYAPVLSRFADWIVLIDAATGDVVGYAPFNAW